MEDFMKKTGLILIFLVVLTGCAGSSIKGSKTMRTTNKSLTMLYSTDRHRVYYDAYIERCVIKDNYSGAFDTFPCDPEKIKNRMESKSPGSKKVDPLTGI
jgi:hypothetical protein